MNYIFDAEAYQEVIREHTENLTGLRNTYNDAQELLNQLRSYDAGDGEWHRELDSFLQLILMYHRDLASNGEDWRPYLQFIRAFEELNENLENYQSVSNSYRELRGS